MKRTRGNRTRALERFAKVDTLIVDKTGTLTEGKPVLSDVVSLIGDEDTLLSLAGSLEKGSEHPLAEAVVAGTEARGLRLYDVSDVEATTGKGVTGMISGRAVSLRNRAMMQVLGLNPEPVCERADALPEDKKALVDDLHAKGHFVAMESAGITLVKGDLNVVANDCRCCSEPVHCVSCH